MSVAETILQQLGGQRFTAMTGSKNYLADGNSLRMTLAKNHSKANRLAITLDGQQVNTGLRTTKAFIASIGIFEFERIA